MRIDDTNLNYHCTFKPQIIYIAKLLKLAGDNFIGYEKEISNVTGIPTGESTGKVLPHLNYAKYMGLIEFNKEKGKYKLETTKLGNLIIQEDPYLLEEITKSILQYNITDILNGAPQWSYMFKVFNYELEEKYEFKNIIKSLQAYFGKSTLKMGFVKSSYESDCFESLGLIDILSSDKVKFNSKYIRMDFLNIYAYTLMKSIEEFYDKVNENKEIHRAKEVTINDIINEIKWNRPFGFDFETTLAVLDEMELEGYIKINKQLNPITIIKLYDSEEIMPKIYGFSM